MQSFLLDWAVVSLWACCHKKWNSGSIISPIWKRNLFRLGFHHDAATSYVYIYTVIADIGVVEGSTMLNFCSLHRTSKWYLFGLSFGGCQVFANWSFQVPGQHQQFGIHLAVLSGTMVNWCIWIDVIKLVEAMSITEDGFFKALFSILDTALETQSFQVAILHFRMFSFLLENSGEDQRIHLRCFCLRRQSQSVNQCWGFGVVLPSSRSLFSCSCPAAISLSSCG